MAEAFLYDARGHDRQIELGEARPDRLKADQLVWIDVDRADADGLAAAGRALAIAIDACGELGSGAALTQLQRFPGYFQFAVTLAPSHGEPGDRRLDFLVAPHWLLTVRDGEVPFLTDFRTRDRAETEIGKLSPASLAASLLDWHLESYFAAIAHIEAAIDQLDEASLAQHSDRAGLGRLAAMRRRVSGLRRRLADQRGIYHGLVRPDFDPVAGSGALEHFQAVERRFERAVDQLDSARAAVAGSFDLFATMTAQDTNDLVKRLTFLTVLIGVIGAVAGVFGMNFETDFSKSGEHGFHIVIGTMAVVSVASAVIARRRQWI